VNLNRVIALYIIVAVLVLGVAGLLGAVLVLDSMHAGPEPVSVPDEFELPAAPAVP
jgi:hypothetical protein